MPNSGLSLWNQDLNIMRKNISVLVQQCTLSVFQDIIFLQTLYFIYSSAEYVGLCACVFLDLFCSFFFTSINSSFTLDYPLALCHWVHSARLLTRLNGCKFLHFSFHTYLAFSCACSEQSRKNCKMIFETGIELMYCIHNSQPCFHIAYK